MHTSDRSFSPPGSELVSPPSRTAAVRTRMPGGVGGAEPRGSPLSRSLARRKLAIRLHECPLLKIPDLPVTQNASSRGITLVVLNSLGDYVVFASPAQIAVAQVRIDHCHLPHHGHSFGTVRHSSHSVGHLGEILACARHHLCGSRRQGKGRKCCGNH